MIMGPEPSIRPVLADLRAAFPVLQKVAYLNAGSVGPVPLGAVEAAERQLRLGLEEGRASKAQFDRLLEMGDALRTRVAARARRLARRDRADGRHHRRRERGDRRARPRDPATRS